MRRRANDGCGVGLSDDRAYRTHIIYCWAVNCDINLEECVHVYMNRWASMMWYFQLAHVLTYRMIA
jgi:hypothetical protein